MDFGERLKSAFKAAYLDGFKKKIIIVGIAVIVIILFLTIIVTILLKSDEESKLNSNSNNKVFGNDFVVCTTEANASPVITDRNVLINAINSLEISSQAKANLISQVDTFLEIQNTYHVNAVFCASVPIVESTAGTGWDLIDPSTNNWVSIKGSKGGGYIDRNGTSWNVYSNFGESSRDMAELISREDSPYYFAAGNTTVMAIASHYCNESWGKSIVEYMTAIYEAAGIEVNTVSITGNAIVDTAARLYMQMYQENWGYNQGCHGNPELVMHNGYCEKWNGYHYHGKLTDCSSFVCRVLKELGYNISMNTAGLFKFNPAAYGLEEICEVIHYDPYSVDANFFRPGDIVVRRSGDNGHVNIVAAVKDGYTYVYDAGAESNWMKHKGQMWAYNSHWQEASVIIRFH